ncbi:MAG: outer membrane beta-barrel protein [Bacteroidetes bacterium]|nr:outer membrane beta-barrel protein [Bacteroidota bacterium]
MLKKILAVTIAFTGFISTKAQTDSTKKAPVATNTFTASVDAYYRTNFNAPTGKTNNYTSFTNSQNSFELGMASVRWDHTIGKISATADLGFGRRANEFSYNDAGAMTAIKQLYVSYQISDKIKLTMGKWATHVGFELLDAYANRNYSMSYGFSYGPFFHTGLKADVSLGGKSAFMIGVANPTDYTTTTSVNKVAIAQFSTGTKDDKLKAFLNYQGGSTGDKSGFNQFDLVLNGVKTNGVSSSWSSNALYLNFDPSSKVGLTLRGEYFDDKKSVTSAGIGSTVFATTLSANIKIDNLTIIPELRVDNGSNAIFFKGDGTATQTTSGFLIAAVYKF